MQLKRIMYRLGNTVGANLSHHAIYAHLLAAMKLQRMINSAKAANNMPLAREVSPCPAAEEYA